MEFKNFKKDVEAAFNNMIAENLFVANDAPSNTELELKFNIVKEIITDKLKEKADREAAKNKAVEKARLTELLAKKQSEKLESLSEDEIKRRLAELG